MNLKNQNIDYKITNPRLNLQIDRDKAYELGVSAESIARTMETLLASNKVTTFSKDGLTYNVILQADEKFRVNLNSLDNIYIKSSKSSLIPLSNLVKTLLRSSLFVIDTSCSDQSINFLFNVSR